MPRYLHRVSLALLALVFIPGGASSIPGPIVTLWKEYLWFKIIWLWESLWFLYIVAHRFNSPIG
jgi:hypothetical protein